MYLDSRLETDTLVGLILILATELILKQYFSSFLQRQKEKEIKLKSGVPNLLQTDLVML